jgi:predicted RNA-binding Zn-ribbon protein involved in translation (DUF1610 family)
MSAGMAELVCLRVLSDYPSEAAYRMGAPGRSGRGRRIAPGFLRRLSYVQCVTWSGGLRLLALHAEAKEEESVAEQPQRYCTSCGHELSAEYRFCPNCGTPVHSNVQATQTRQSVRNDEQPPSSNNHLPSDRTAPEQEYSDYLLDYDEDDAALNANIPDVLLDAPVVQLGNLDFELDDLRAKVSLFAKVLDLVEISVGIDAFLGKVKLTIESLEVQALLKVRLDNLTRILDRVFTSLDRNPQMVQELTRGVSSAVGDIGSGAGSAVEDVGEGAGEAVEDVGEGAGSAVADVGEGAGAAVEEVGGGAGKALGEVGEGAGQVAQEVARGVGQAVDEVGEGAAQAAGQAGQAVQGAPDQAGQAAQRAPVELQDEVKATPSAERLAHRLGVPLSTVEGTGAGGHVTVRDVRSVAQEG